MEESGSPFINSSDSIRSSASSSSSASASSSVSGPGEEAATTPPTPTASPLVLPGDDGGGGAGSLPLPPPPPPAPLPPPEVEVAGSTGATSSRINKGCSAEAHASSKQYPPAARSHVLDTNAPARADERVGFLCTATTIPGHHSARHERHERDAARIFSTNSTVRPSST